MRIAYVRVSSVDQNEARQIEGLKKHNIEKWFVEKASAKDTSRPQLQTMLEFAREGDTIYIHDFSRLARSTATGKLMLTMIGAINEFERANLLERQKEGIAIAKRNGCYKGGKKGRNTAQFDEALYKELLVAYQHRKISKSAMAKRLGVSRPTLNKMMKSNLL